MRKAVKIMSEKFKASHFDNIDDLLKHCDMWLQDDDYDAYCRFFDIGAMEELNNYINSLQQRIDKAIELCNIILKNEPLENNPNYDLIDQIASIKSELLKGEDKEC